MGKTVIAALALAVAAVAPAAEVDICEGVFVKGGFGIWTVKWPGAKAMHLDRFAERLGLTGGQLEWLEGELNDRLPVGKSKLPFRDVPAVYAALRCEQNSN